MPYCPGTISLNFFNACFLRLFHAVLPQSVSDGELPQVCLLCNQKRRSSCPEYPVPVWIIFGTAHAEHSIVSARRTISSSRCRQSVAHGDTQIYLRPPPELASHKQRRNAWDRLPPWTASAQETPSSSCDFAHLLPVPVDRASAPCAPAPCCPGPGKGYPCWLPGVAASLRPEMARCRFRKLPLELS